jgi:hypothetical protein
MTAIVRLVLVAGLPLALAFGPLGCGKTSTLPVKVSGQITYNKKPVKGGSINFYLVGAGSAGAYGISINSDATYSITDMPAGEMVVTVETDSALPLKAQAQMQGHKMTLSPGNPNYKSDAAEYVKIPDKYKSKSTTPLKVTLNPGQNKQDFDLTD